MINHSYMRATFSPRHGRIAACVFWTTPPSAVRPAAAHLRLLDDAHVRHAGLSDRGPEVLNNWGEVEMAGQPDRSRCEPAERGRFEAPPEVSSSDPDVLRAALIRESIEHRRAECRATMQAEVVKLALDLLVREPDIEGFFGGLTKTMVEESESYTCAVWLLDEEARKFELSFGRPNEQRNFAFTFERPEPNVLKIEGSLPNQSIRATLRRTEKEFFLTSRGFHWINEFPLNR